MGADVWNDIFEGLTIFIATTHTDT